MALDVTALASVEDLKGFMGGVAGSNADYLLETSINEASAVVNGFLGRTLCGLAPATTPFERTEYHSLCRDTHELHLLEKPYIVSVTSVHEDTTRTYAASALLTVNTDYIVDNESGKLLRVTLGGGAKAWVQGFEAIKVVAVLGYKGQNGIPASAPAVPGEVKYCCLWIAARLFKEGMEKRWDTQSATDASGTRTVFSSNPLPPMIERRLYNYRDLNQNPTGRRAV